MLEVVLLPAYRIMWAVYTVLLAIGSLQPARPGGLHQSNLHPLLHLASFALLFLLSRNAFPAWLWQSVAGSMLFGLALELAQSLIYRFPVEWPDVLTDAVGVCLGSVLWALFALHKRRVRS
jgi:VanZ family protein